MQPFKIRASACGHIMTNARKKDELSKTCTSYLEQWVKEQIYGRRKEISTKYMDKGIEMEDVALEFAAKVLDYGMLFKNEEFFEDDYMRGTPDAILSSEIIDIKCSWDCFTFPLFSDEIKKDYYWQSQVYMHLAKKDHFKLVYCLMDTPEHLITKEAMYKVGPDNLTDEILKEYKDKMTYPSIDNKYKIKVYEIEKNQDDINSIIERVKECNQYINQLITNQ